MAHGISDEAFGRSRKAITELDAHTLAALAHPTRIRIVAAIGPGGVTGDRLAATLADVSPDMCWHHAGILRKAGLVDRTRTTDGDRRSYVYRLVPEVFEGVGDRLNDPAFNYGPWSDTPLLHA